MPDPNTRARLLATHTKEAGARLHPLPISSLGLRMHNEAIRVAVGLHLRLPLCRPHLCSQCGSEVDASGTHGLSCEFSQGRHSRSAAMNDVLKRSLEEAKIPSHLEPSDIFRTDGKQPDGVSINPWKRGRALVRDVTCPDTLAPSYEHLKTREAGAVAAQMECRKDVKYAHLNASHLFAPIAIETFGVMEPEARLLSGAGQVHHRGHIGSPLPQAPGAVCINCCPVWQRCHCLGHTAAVLP